MAIMVAGAAAVVLLLLVATAQPATAPPPVSVAVNASAGRDGAGCGRAAARPCATVAGALRQLGTADRVVLRLAEGEYPIAAPLAMPAGVHVEITLPAPPLGQHRSILSCAEGVAAPCITVGDRASLRLDCLSVASMMVAAGPGGRLATRSCKFDAPKGVAGVLAGQVGLLDSPPSASGALPLINMTDTDPSSRPSLATPVALLASAPVTARILLGIGNHSRAAPTLPPNASEDDFKGYQPELMGHDCYRPQYRSSTPPVTKKLLTVAGDGSGDFTTVQAAINAIPEGGRSSWAEGVTVHVKSGTYNETVCVNRNKSFVTLRGDGPDSTAIVGSKGSIELMFRAAHALPASAYHLPRDHTS